MKRSGFKAKPAKIGLSPSFPKKAPFKRSSPRTTKIRKAARGQECTLRYPVCNFNTETTVLCHSNRLEDGKSMGKKAPDTEAAFGCSRCHDLLDGRMPIPAGMTYEDIQEGFDRGREATNQILDKAGLLKKNGYQKDSRVK